MDDKTTFCNECNHEVIIEGASTTLKGKLKGQTYFYEGEIPLSNCGHNIVDDEINIQNLKALHDTYRRENGIISLEKIQEIPAKYDIGKRPLSNLLEWGELTFSRYFEGDIPSKAYSKILEEVYNNPAKYLDILETNKHFISVRAYQKSAKATHDLLQKNSKINNVLIYILYNVQDITPLGVQKLLYYCQGFYLAFYGETLFNDTCYAGEYGPIFPVLEKDFLKKFTKDGVEDYNFLPCEKAIIDSVIKNFACYSSMVLTRFTSLETPWILAYQPTNQDFSCIENNDILTYFLEVVKKYKMISPADIYLYATSMFASL